MCNSQSQNSGAGLGKLSRKKNAGGDDNFRPCFGTMLMLKLLVGAVQAALEHRAVGSEYERDRRKANWPMFSGFNCTNL